MIHMSQLYFSVAMVIAMIPRADAEDPIKFIKERVGKCVGSGECSDLACEALRVSGKEFFVNDPDKNGDYVWGTLIKQISHSKQGWKDSDPESKLQPGDVIQYRHTAFGKTVVMQQHTAVVAEVNPQGYPTFVFEQNSGSENDPRLRTVQRNPVDLTRITGGTASIYRPKTMEYERNRYKFAVVNNAGTKQAAQVFFDNALVANLSANKTTSRGSYPTAWLAGTGVPTLRLSNGKNIRIEDRACYEIYQITKTDVGIRKMNP
jgi:hypothetical protein